MKITRTGTRSPRALAIGAALTAVALTLSACGSGGGTKVEDAGGTALETPDQAAWEDIVAKAKEEGEVTVFVSPNAEVAFEEFEKQYPEISVTVERAPTTDLIPRLDQELSVPTPAADVAYHGLPTWFLDNGSQQLLAPIQYSPEVIEATPPTVERTRYYTPVLRNPFLIGYNTNLAEEPTSVEQVVKSAAGKKVGLLGISSPSTAYQWMTWDQNLPGLLDDITELDYVPAPSLVPLAQAMAAGEYTYIFPMGPSTLTALMAEGAPVGQAIMTENNTAVEYGAGITASAPHPNAAQVFTNWLMSPDNADLMLKYFGPGALPTKSSDGLEWEKLTPFERSGVSQEELDTWVDTVFNEKIAK